jgi:hypothetical protein
MKESRAPRIEKMRGQRNVMWSRRKISLGKFRIEVDDLVAGVEQERMTAS